MDLKRKDTPDGRAFWEFVETTAEQQKQQRPAWARMAEEKDLFLVLLYCATSQGTKAIDMPRKDIALAFFLGLVSFFDGKTYDLRQINTPYTDWTEVNKMLSDTGVLGSIYKDQAELSFNLSELLKFRRKEYVGPPESEVWYESDFEELLKELNKTHDLSYAMSVNDFIAAEAILAKLSPRLKDILVKISETAALNLRLC